MAESFVDLVYRGLSLGRRVKLTQVRPTTGYLEVPAPMPVGTTIAVQTDEGIAFDVVVAAIHEQVGGSDRPPGMTVQPQRGASDGTWWRERVTLPEEVAPPPVPVRGKPITVRPRTSTVVEASPAGAPAAAPDDATMAALAAASQTVAHGGGADAGKTIAMTAVAEPVAPEDTGRTVMMPGVDPEPSAAPRDTDVERLMAVGGEHAVVDDGKQTTMMDAVDLSALGLDMPGGSREMAAAKAEDGDDEPDPRDSRPNLPSSVKKRKRRNR